MSLYLYNSLTRTKELFEPLHPPFVGMYVCGPTVYNYAHLGNVRTFLTFDILYRYLVSSGYKVRYVRNITDVGHLESDADTGEDKIGKKARLENLEPMEIVQRYTNDFHEILLLFNLVPPSIEPTATGHIVEQIEAVKKLIGRGLAYESNGSVYFDIQAYQEQYGNYGTLSGRVIEEMLNETRDLDGVGDKRFALDFAVWKKAAPEHIMRWPSPWGEGFPGWHIECTCMSTKYLGEQFDIHGGGMDLKFPHHECEIAQGTGVTGMAPVKYWLHSNMLTVNGQKMSKSLGNSFLPRELITGSHPLLEKAYHPMPVRFFMLGSHYRSTLDFSNAALQGAEKAFERLSKAIQALQGLRQGHFSGFAAAPAELEMASGILQRCKSHMDDDLNTAKVIAELFDILPLVNQVLSSRGNMCPIPWDAIETLRKDIHTIFQDWLGLQVESEENRMDETMDNLMRSLIELRAQAKKERNFVLADTLRDTLSGAGIRLKDTPQGTEWYAE